MPGPHNLLVAEAVEYLIDHPDEDLADVLLHKFPDLTWAELELAGERFEQAAKTETDHD